MEDFCNEKSFGGIVREIILNSELASEDSSLVRSANWAFDIGLNVSCVAFVNDHLDAYINVDLPGGPLVSHSCTCLARVITILGLSPC